MERAYSVAGHDVGPDGVITYHLETPFQPGPCPLRVREPDRPPGTRRACFVLPVEEGDGTRYGDGLATAMGLDLHNRLGFTLVAPSFVDVPWYGDHATDVTIRQESHMVEAVVPFVEEHYPCAPGQRGLLGFSKSGWGAYALILRNPDRFGAACAWDAPLCVAEPAYWEMGTVFADQANFAPYRVTHLLEAQAPHFRDRQRLGLFGYDNFLEHVEETHALMLDLRIPHEYADGPKRPHHWDGGWVDEAAAALDRMMA